MNFRLKWLQWHTFISWIYYWCSAKPPAPVWTGVLWHPRSIFSLLAARATCLTWHNIQLYSYLPQSEPSRDRVVPRATGRAEMSCIGKWKFGSVSHPCSGCTGRWHSPLSLQSFLQGVLENILDCWMEFRWIWMLVMTHINIKEALCKISGL